MLLLLANLFPVLFSQISSSAVYTNNVCFHTFRVLLDLLMFRFLVVPVPLYPLFGDLHNFLASTFNTAFANNHTDFSLASDTSGFFFLLNIFHHPLLTFFIPLWLLVYVSFLFPYLKWWDSLCFFISPFLLLDLASSLTISNAYVFLLVVYNLSDC